jgi:DNA-binding transcriptional LysR family regulator
MELRHLRYFQAVAQTLSFSRAAAQLRIAQPAVSRQIVALEDELGLKLFERTTTRVRLTDAGRHFLGEVDRLLAHLAIAVTGTQQIASGRGGQLNLGIDWRISVPQIPAAVLALRSELPHVTTNFVELNAHAQIEALRDGRIHVGFVHPGVLGSRADFGIQPLYTAAIKAVVSPRSPLAGAGSVALRDLREQTWLRLEEKNHPGFRSFITQLCHPALFSPKFGRTANSIEGMLALVAMGDGICLIPSSLVRQNHPDLVLLDTDCPPFEVHAIWRKDAPSESRTRLLELLSASLGPRAAAAPAAKRRAPKLTGAA